MPPWGASGTHRHRKLPGRTPDRRVTELKPWARAAVSAWVLTALTALGAMVTLIVTNASAVVAQDWRSLVLQIRAVSAGLRVGNAVYTINAAVDTFMLPL
ncbi:MAG: hypothetical protein JOZ07_12120 [Solirubrobacterales bacterium]|nr:hypothetical protein [Solirubrobacterales bacterium]